jgi:hypothetical protein
MVVCDNAEQYRSEYADYFAFLKANGFRTMTCHSMAAWNNRSAASLDQVNLHGVKCLFMGEIIRFGAWRDAAQPL